MLPTKANGRVQTAGFQPVRSSAPREKLGAKTARDLAITHKGLCSNCEKLEECSYPSTTSETWFCEEYSCAKAEESPKLQVLDPSKETAEGRETQLGLCVNCAQRETCQFPRPAGGVWFCGEYE